MATSPGGSWRTVPTSTTAALDWEGTLFRAEGPNLLTYLPTALKNYPAYAATGDQAAHDAIIGAGFAPGSEFLWPFHETVYWDLTQRIYREELDPTFDGDLKAGIPFCASGTPHCDADYDYASRPAAVKRGGRLGAAHRTRSGKPMLTVQGTLDTLLPPATDADVYDRLVDRAGPVRCTATTASRTAPTPTACMPRSPTGCAPSCRAPGRRSRTSPAGSSAGCGLRRTVCGPGRPPATW